MKIEVLGTGCPKCKKLMELTQEAAKETGIQAEISKVDKIDEIMNYGVMITPALAIDGKVVIAGSIPSKEELKKILTEKPCSDCECNKPRNSDTCCGQ